MLTSDSLKSFNVSLSDLDFAGHPITDPRWNKASNTAWDSVYLCRKSSGLDTAEDPMFQLGIATPGPGVRISGGW
ncbi:unnamed protein product [marine sediment metagenome]|uniref:Uncharacterized protein n=1 Tax=marine sediment metagenome TaxID=412755 RepID=X0UCJ1_9ZZZZ